MQSTGLFLAVLIPSGIASAPEPARGVSSAPSPAGSRFGYAVASAGDVNGDGFEDVLVGEPGHDGSAVAMADVNGDGFCDVVAGAPFFDDAFADEGRVVAYLGSAAGLSSIEHATLVAP